MKTIVVGTDGSAGAANALRWASRLAATTGAELVVMTGFRPRNSELPASRVESLVAEREAELQAWSEAAELGSVPVRAVVERGDPRSGILAVAEREEADLIVIGRIGASAGPGLLHVGSMAEYLAHHSSRPLAVIGGAVNLTIRSILVGVDGSDPSQAALRWVKELATVSEKRIVAAAVEEPFLEWTPETSPQNWRRATEQRIRTELAVEFAEAGLEFSPLALRGLNVADALLQAAKDERTDIIVVGLRGLGGFTGLRVGGVAVKILHRSDRPVVLIPTT